MSDIIYMFIITAVWVDYVFNVNSVKNLFLVRYDTTVSVANSSLIYVKYNERKEFPV